MSTSPTASPGGELTTDSITTPLPHFPPTDASLAMLKAASVKAVRIALQILVIIGICMVGSDLSGKIPIPIPGTIISMVLLLVLLATGVLRVLYIKDACEFLLGNMSVFFIPAGVSVASSFATIAPEFPKLLIICAITTVLVFVVTSATVVLVMRWQAKVRLGQPSPRLNEQERQVAKPADSAVQAAINVTEMVVEQDIAHGREDV